MLISSALCGLWLSPLKKPFDSLKVPLINPQKFQGKLTAPEFKNANFELISKFQRISSST